MPPKKQSAAMKAFLAKNPQSTLVTTKKATPPASPKKPVKVAFKKKIKAVPIPPPSPPSPPKKKFAFKKKEKAKAQPVSIPLPNIPGGQNYKEQSLDKKPLIGDGDLNAYILTYEGNESMAIRLEKQLRERGFPHVRIVYAPDMAKTGMRRSRVVFHTFKNYLLPLLEKSTRDTIVFEDDADVYSPYSLYQKLASKWPMNRISQWGAFEKEKGKPKFLVGSTIVSYKKAFIPRFAAQMRKDREQHIDGWLAKKFKWKEEWDVEPKKGFGGTISHHSYILNNTYREGALGSDAPKGYKIPVIRAGFKRGIMAEGDRKPELVQLKD